MQERCGSYVKKGQMLFLLQEKSRRVTSYNPRRIACMQASRQPTCQTLARPKFIRGKRTTNDIQRKDQLQSRLSIYLPINSVHTLERREIPGVHLAHLCVITARYSQKWAADDAVAISDRHFTRTSNDPPKRSALGIGGCQPRKGRFLLLQKCAESGGPRRTAQCDTAGCSTPRTNTSAACESNTEKG